MRFSDWFPWGRDQRRALLRAELESHLAMDVEDRLARGEAGDDALANARKDFGNPALVYEVTHETWAGLWLERAVQDIRFGARMLRRAPFFTVIAVLCLALGVGANATVLSWTEGILLRPYPGVARQDQLVAVAGTVSRSAGFDAMSWPDYMDLARGTHSLSAFIVSKITGATLTGGDRQDRLVGLLVSANYFDALGVRTVRGRGFLAGEDVGQGAHPVVVISYRLWKDRFGGDVGIIGRTIGLNGIPHTIVGVTPPEFLGTFVGYAVQFWLPASQQAVVDPTGYKLDDRSARWIEGFARLKAGVTLAQAQSEISAAAKSLVVDHPAEDRGRGVVLLRLRDAPFDGAKEMRPMLRIAGLVAAFVLMIACANVANLLLVRALSRRPEMTVRLAIGAGRERIVRQLVTESALLAAIATLAGIGVAYLSRNLLAWFYGDAGGAPISFAGDVDWRTIAVSASIGLASVFGFGLVPAVQASSIDLTNALKSSSGGNVGGGRGRLRSSLVAVQVCLSFVLLVGAGLLFTSLRRLRAESPGFDRANVLATALNLFANNYDTTRARQFDDELLRRTRASPGVEGVALARSTPFSKRPYDRGEVSVDGYSPARDEIPAVDYNQVTPDYFHTMGIPIVSGRPFAVSDVDTSTRVAVVSQAMATKYWPGIDPVGKRLRLSGRWMQVVGVARDIKHRSLLEPSAPIVYVPLAQNFSTVVGMFIRTERRVAEIAPALVSTIHSIDPDVAPYEVLTLEDQLDRSASVQRIALTLVAAFAAAALLLAAIGLYGIVSYAVSQSARELALRIALGATPREVLALVTTWGIHRTVVGIALGVALALATTRLFGDLLFRVSPHDPLAFASAFVLMCVVALGACVVPAVRAARTDAMKVLRTQC